MAPTWLLEYKRTVYSQTGEDGIIEKILEIIPDDDKWCVDFGAGDGAAVGRDAGGTTPWVHTGVDTFVTYATRRALAARSRS